MDQSECVDDRKATKSQKVVKNFNEFLNFASINKNRISDKLGSNKPALYSQDTSEEMTPLIKLTKSSFEDTDTNTTPMTSSNSAETEKLPLQLQLNNVTGRPISIDGSSPDDSQEYFPMTTSMTRELRLERKYICTSPHSRLIRNQCR